MTDWMTSALAVGLLAGLARCADAAGGSWTNDGSGNWSDGTRWSGGSVADGAGATAWFTNNITATRTVTVDTARVIGNLTVGDAAGGQAFNFTPASGATLTFDNGGNTAQFNQTAAAGAQTFGVPVILASPLAISNASANALTFTNGISGTGSLTLQAGAAGGITLSTAPVNIAGAITNSGTGSGAVTISGGVGTNVTAIVQAQTNADLTIGTAPLLVNRNGTLLANNNRNGTKKVTVSGGVGGTGDLVLQNNSAVGDGITFSTTAITNIGQVVNSGTGPSNVLINVVISSNATKVIQDSTNSALLLRQANTFTNGLWIKSGAVIVNVNQANALGANTNVVTIGDTNGTKDATLLYTGAGVTFLQPIMVPAGNTGIATIDNRPSGTVDYSAPVTLSNNLTFSSSGTAGARLLGGVTGVGNLTLKADSANGSITIITLPVNIIGTITNSGTGTATATIGNTGGVGTNVTAIVQASTNSPLTISAPLLVNSSGTLLVNNGKKLFTVSGSVGGTGDLVVSNNATDIANAFTISGTVSNYGMVVNSSGSGTGTVTISAIINSNVTKVIQNSTDSMLSLTGANTFSNGLWIKAGTVIGNTSVNALGANSNIITLGDTNGNASAWLVAAGSLTCYQPIMVSSGNTGVATIEHTSSGKFSGPSTLNSHDLTYVSTYSGLGGNASYLSGGFTGVGNLTLMVNAGGNATIDTTPFNHRGAIINAGTGTNTVRFVGAPGLSLIGSNVTAIIQNSIKSRLVFDGNVILTVNSGGTTLANNGGTNLLFDTPNLSVINGTGDLILSNNSAIVNGIEIRSPVTNSGQVVNAGTGSGDVLISGAIRPGVTNVLQNSASSRLVLSGANTYSGTTVVTNGALKVDGSLSSGNAVLVYTNGILQGSGTISGTNTVYAGGLVSPGPETTAGGTLKIGDVIWNDGGIYKCQVANLAGVAGIDYDQISVARTLTNTLGQKFILRLDSMGQTLDFNTNLNYSLKVLTCGTAASLDPADITLDTSAFLLSDSGTWMLTNQNKSIYAYYQPNVASMNYWINSTGSGKWTNDANWSLGHVPQPGEDVVFDWHSLSNCTVDVASNNLGSLTLDATYAGTVTVATVYPGNGTFTNLSIAGDCTILSGVLTHTANSGGETNRLRVSVGGNLLIANAAINADALGYSSGSGGPGAGTQLWEGGSYGGVAVNMVKEPAVTFRTYGSIVAPTNLGSKAATSGPSGLAGGGAIFLTVGGTATVASAGLITANGSPQSQSSGSGGSVFLTTGWLTGSGTIQANAIGTGGNGVGGGGRVAICLTGAGADFSAWSGSNTAYGAGAGTVYRKMPAGADELIIDNNNTLLVSQSCTLMPPDVNLGGFSNVIIRRKGVLGVRGDTTLDFGAMANFTTFGATNSYIAIVSDTNVTYPANLSIAGYTLIPQGLSKPLTDVTIGANGGLSHFGNQTSETYRLNLTLAGNLTVLSNGTISADGLGYAYDNGPGKGTGYWMGGAYGGGGIWSAGAPNQRTYGSILVPTNIGSSGYQSSSGGGAISLTVAGTTTVNSAGTITANGNGVNLAGGSGGSILLTTGWLTGSGTIRANGGTSSPGYGGGGRVAIIQTQGASFAFWTGTNVAYGGGAPGTVYLQAAGTAAGAGTVIVNNGSTATNATFTPLPAFSNSTENISKTAWVTTSKTRLALVANASVASLSLSTTNAYLELAGCTGAVSTLTITNRSFAPGVYGASALGALVSDSSGGAGQIVVMGMVNSNATSVTATSAVLNATLSGFDSCWDVYAYWGTVDGTNNASGLWANTNYVGAFWLTNGVISTNIAYLAASGLVAHATNYYTFLATNAATTLWASPSTNFGYATVTLGSLGQTYDGSAKTATVTTVPAGLSVVVTYNGSSAYPTNAGSYAVTATVSSAIFTGQTNGTLVVSPRALTIAATAQTKVYGTALTNATGYTAFTTNGLVAGETITAVSVAYTNNGALSNAAVGTYTNTIAISAATGFDTNNYTITYVPTNLTIVKAQATITASGTNVVYDGAAHGASGIATGVAGENLNGLLNLGAVYTNVPGGTANWTFAGDANHVATNGAVSIVISKSGLVVVWPTASSIAPGQALSNSVLSGGVVSNAALTLTVPGTFAFTNAAFVPPAGVYFTDLVFTPDSVLNYQSATGGWVRVNRIPVAGADESGTRQGRALSISVVKLLHNDMDTDGNALIVTNVNASASNGVVTLAAGMVTYTNADFSGTDTFTYVVSDGVGGVATGTVTVVVEPAAGGAVPLNIVSGPLLEGGAFVVRFAGIPGYTYTAEYNTNLLSPVWLKKENMFAPVTNAGFGIGVFELRDVTSDPQRYYRTIWPSY